MGAAIAIVHFRLRARYLNPDTGRFWTMDVYEGVNSDPLSLHRYLYAACNPVNAHDPSGQMTVSELSGVMNILGQLMKMARPVLKAYFTARSILDVIGVIHAGVSLVTSGRFDAEFLASKAALGHFDVNEAIDSIFRNYQHVLARAFPVWSTWLLSGKGLSVEGFVVYLPSPPTGALYAAVPAGRFRGYKLTLIAGGARHTSRIFGVGFDMRGVSPQFQQVWRMDYHPLHFVPGTARFDLGANSIAVVKDGPFHHHVLKPQ